MNIAILDVRVGSGRKVENSYTVAYRNLAVLRDELKADLFINPSDINFKKNYDVIICGFGSTSCEKDLSTRFLLQNDNARIFWLVGDYEQSTFAPLFYSKREFEVLCTFGDHKIKNKMMTRQHQVNINALLTRSPNPHGLKKYDCVYYGRWRPDRLKYFKQYLDSFMYVSTGVKNIKMFHHNGCNPKFIKPLGWESRTEALNLFRSSLYIEDVFSHSNYTALGNRFYEALWCNAVPLIDSSCRRTLELSGYKDYEWHIVESTNDIKEKCIEIAEGFTGSMRKWQKLAVAEKKEVILEIKSIIGLEYA